MLKNLANWFRTLFQARRRTIRGFDWSELSFDPPNVDYLATKLQVEARAARDARNNQPSPSAESTTGTEENIVAWLSGEIRSTVTQSLNRVAYLQNRINSEDLKHLRAQADGLVGDFVTQLEDLYLSAKDELQHMKEEAEAANLELARFKVEHEIDWDARLGHRIRFFVFASLFAVIEGALNSFFFYQGSVTGVAGGLSIAFLLAVLDMVAMSILGRLAAPVILPRFWYRLLGVLTIVFAVSLALVYNIAVSHIREQLQLNPETYLEAARLSLVNSPFGLRQLDSWMFFGFGFLLSMLGLANGATWDEPFWGYAKRTRRASDRRRVFQDNRQSFFQEASNLKKKAGQNLQDLQHRTGDERKTLAHYVATRETLLENINTYKSDCEQVCNALLQMYRFENRAHRTEPAPPYFDSQWEYPAREADPGVQPFDPKAVQKKVQRLEGEIGRRVKKIHAQLDAEYEAFLDRTRPQFALKEEEKQLLDANDPDRGVA